MVDATWPQPRLTNGETLTLTLEYIAPWHSHILEVDLGVALPILISQSVLSRNASGGISPCRPCARVCMRTKATKLSRYPAAHLAPRMSA